MRGRTGPGPNAVGLSRGHIMDQIAGSLKRLGLDHVDLYQIHGFDPVTPIEETLRALDDCVSRGLVRTIGCSNLAAWQIMKALGISERRGFARFETVQAYYTIAGRDLEREILPLVEDQGLGVMVWSPLAGGLLVGQVHARWRQAERRAARRRSISRRSTASARSTSSTRCGRSPRRTAPRSRASRSPGCLQRKGVMSVIVGAKTIEQLDDNLAAAELTLSAEEIAALDKVSALTPEYPGWMIARQSDGRVAGAEGVRRGANGGRDHMRKVSWGVLGVAKIGVEKVIPAMQRGEVFAHRRDRLARSRQSAAAAAALGIAKAYGSYEELLADPDDRGDLQSRCPTNCTCPGRSARSRRASTCCARSRSRSTPGRRETLIAARDALRQAGRRSLHGALSSAMAARARDRAVGRDRRRARDPDVLLLPPDRPDNIRNQPPGGGALYDIGCYAILTARYVFAAEPTRVVAALDVDPAFGTDRLTSALIEFPGGRHLTFTCATQLSAHQRVTIVGETGRIEIAIPFNAPNDRPTRITIDSGVDLVGGGARVEEFPVCDQYTLQGDAFSRAVLGEAPLEFPIEDAVANMRVIDAAFRSARSGGWERP